MRRVVHVISTPRGIGGAERLLIALLEAGAEAGWEQAVLNPFGEAGGGELARACTEADSKLRFEARPCRSARGVPGLRRWLRSRLGELDANLVHAHLFHAMVLVASLRRSSSRPVMLTHHHGDQNLVERRWLRLLADRWLARRFSRVIAVSQWEGRFLVDTYGYPASLIEVIPNGWSGEPQPRALSGRPTVVCVARLREQKGHDDLLRAFALVRTQIPDVRLHLVGDGPRRPALEALAAKLDLGDAVRFEGDVDDVWPALAAGDLFVLASLYEPLGIAVLEAMAAGLPIVATEVGGIPELARGCALLVPPRSPEDLAAAIARGLTDRQWGTQASECGRRRAQQNRMQATTSSYMTSYGELTGGP